MVFETIAFADFATRAGRHRLAARRALTPDAHSPRRANRRGLRGDQSNLIDSDALSASSLTCAGR